MVENRNNRVSKRESKLALACAWCHSLDERNGWYKPSNDEYQTKIKGKAYSHGICEACNKEYFGKELRNEGLYWKYEKSGKIKMSL